MKCAKCGAECADGAHFCLTCGNDLFLQAQQVAGAQEQVRAEQAAPAEAPKTEQQYQQGYPYQPPVIQQTIVQEKPIRSVDDLPKRYRPISMWGYFGIELLFSIPVGGFIFMLVWSFGGTRNINKRNFARSYFCGFIIILLLAIIVFLLGIIFGGTVPAFLDKFIK